MILNSLICKLINVKPNMKENNEKKIKNEVIFDLPINSYLNRNKILIETVC